MGILENAKRLVGKETEQEQTTLYRCLTCQNEFEAMDRQATDVACSNCGANAVQKVQREV